MLIFLYKTTENEQDGVEKKIQFYLCPRGNTNTSRLQLKQISKDRAK